MNKKKQEQENHAQELVLKLIQLKKQLDLKLLKFKNKENLLLQDWLKKLKSKQNLRIQKLLKTANNFETILALNKNQGLIL